MGKISDRNIGDITSTDTHLTHAHFKRLYKGLHMNDAEIDNAERNADTADVRLRAREVLGAWLSSNGKEATRGKIIEALRQENLLEAKEHLEIKWDLATPVLTDVTDDDIRYISYHTKLEYNGEMRPLFGVLGMSNAEIENIESSTSKDVGSKATAVLNEWRMNNGGKASRKRIIDALVECNFTSTLRELERRWRLAPRVLKDVSSVTKRRVDKEEQHRCREAVGPLDVSSCRKLLKGRYRQKRSGVGFLPGFPKEFSSDEFFVELELAEKQKTPTEVKYVPLQTYTDLLCIEDKQGRSLNHVLVVGLAGTGKTTLVSRLAYQWTTVCDQPDAVETLNLEDNVDSLKVLATFELVFVLDIRKFDPDMNLVEAIKDQLLEHVSVQALQTYLIANADRCLFLFDGYDELSSQQNVLSSNVLYSSNVILTSRPDKVVKINQNHPGYVHVSLNGFSDESVSKFVYKFFGESEAEETDNSKQLLNIIDKSKISRSLSHYPLLLAMMCLIFKDEQKLPETISGLFDLIIKYLVKHWKARKSDYDDISLDQFKTQMKLDDLLVKLGHTAFKGLNEDTKLIFKDDEFESQEVVQQGCEFGLLSMSSRIKGIEVETEVSFIHKTFQEYCAAMYLCSLGTSDIDIEHLIQRLDVNDSGMQNMLKFCCGSSVENAGLILPCIVNTCKRQMESGDHDEHGMIYMYGKEIFQWLPFILLYEVEMRFGFIQSLHEALKPIVTCLQCYPLSDDDDVNNVFSYFVDDCEYKRRWLSLVKTLCIHIEYAQYASYHDYDSEIEYLYVIMISKCTCLEAVYIGDDKFVYRIKVESLNSCLLHIKDHPRSNEIDFTCDAFPCVSAPMEESEMECLVEILQQVSTHAKWRLRCLQTDNEFKLFKRHLCQSNYFQIITGLHNVYIGVVGEGDELRNQIDQIIKAVEELQVESLAGASKQDTQLEEEQTVVPKASTGNERDSRQVVQLPLQLVRLLPDVTEYVLEYLDISLLQFQRYSYSRVNMVKHFESLDALFGIQPSVSHDPDLHDDTVLHEAPPLRNMQHLTELRITVNKVGLHHAFALSEILKNMSQLTKLDLSYNEISSNGCLALCDSFQYTPNLSKLYLTRNHIGSDGAGGLANSLKYINKISVIDLSYNSLGPVGMEAILRSIHHVPDLRCLKLGYLPKEELDRDSTLGVILSKVKPLSEWMMNYYGSYEINVYANGIEGIRKKVQELNK